MTPVSETVDDLEGDDWLGSSSHLGSSEATHPTPPTHPFRQSLDPVAELQQEEEASNKGELNLMSDKTMLVPETTCVTCDVLHVKAYT